MQCNSTVLFNLHKWSKWFVSYRKRFTCTPFDAECTHTHTHTQFSHQKIEQLIKTRKKNIRIGNHWYFNECSLVDTYEMSISFDYFEFKTCFRSLWERHRTTFLLNVTAINIADYWHFKMMENMMCENGKKLLFMKNTFNELEFK